ncbi:peptidase M6 immune inhibitor A [Sporichthya brevicatena]|uniref:peptidase M6 immune inhibitor A n=1 Tax=Sporichthya brevicatena TaxID=171442 RepID=UPI0031CE5DCE
MSRTRRPGARSIAALSALGLAVGLAAGLSGSTAKADVPLIDQALADPFSAASHALDPGVIAHFPHDAVFSLSPELAALVGRATVSADEAAKLLSQRNASSGLAARPGVLPADTPEVGTKRLWPALDMVGKTSNSVPPFGLYLKEYTLQAKRENIEIWVASGTDDISTGTQFPAGDCRSVEADPTVVTPAQAQALADEFQDKQLPISSKYFSTAPPRDGTKGIGQLGLLGGPDFTGNGNSVVTLVDNVRDPNFYDFVNNRTYIAGFFAPIFNLITDRNVMTIDAFDWQHRTGANPKNEPDEDICKSRPARPRTYESVFIHEYQHLLHSYTNPNPSPVGLPFRSEDLWINEGLSDMAPMFAGYADPSITVDRIGAESHIFCFQGYGEKKGKGNANPNYCGGPENSLTLWEDQGGNSDILADYGNAWSFMIFLHDRYGPEMISALHRDPEFGLVSLQNLLNEFGEGVDAYDVLHDFQLMNLLDNIVSAKGVKLTGVDKARITSKLLKAQINYRYKAAYAAPGAAPNGADYVELLGPNGPLAGKDLKSLTFVGPATGPGDVPVENWMVRLVGIDAKGKRVLVRSFENATNLTLTAADLKEFAPFKTVIAVVSVDDLVGAHSGYVPYSLTVNDQLQPGGA